MHPIDILITHSPPFGIHDDDTQAHRGLKAMNWLIRIARPRYHFHGHTHFYRRNLEASETVIYKDKGLSTSIHTRYWTSTTS
jgi:uncharacterized protein